MNTKPDARTAPKASIDALLTTLKEQLAQPGQSLLPLLGAMSRFSKYSLANQMLIFGQRPDATRVQGYRAWNNAGYQVRKGERGIAIYAPMRFTRAEPGDESGPLEPHSRTGFRVAYVFDITQVDPLDGTPAESTPAPSDAGNTDAHRALEVLKAFLVGHNVELEYLALAPGLLGYTDGRRITCGQGQASHVEFATLAHETTHVLLHFARNADGAAGTRPDLTTRETEAEAVTYLLCAQLGIKGTEASVEYIQSYRGTPDTLDLSLERIRATAQRLINELDAIRFNISDDPGAA
jgi:antirestriction protein ArdC